MNVLLARIRSTLAELDLGLKGDLTMSEPMERLMQARAACCRKHAGMITEAGYRAAQRPHACQHTVAPKHLQASSRVHFTCTSKIPSCTLLRRCWPPTRSRTSGLLWPTRLCDRSLHGCTTSSSASRSSRSAYPH